MDLRSQKRRPLGWSSKRASFSINRRLDNERLELCSALGAICRTGISPSNMRDKSQGYHQKKGLLTPVEEELQPLLRHFVFVSLFLAVRIQERQVFQRGSIQGFEEMLMVNHRLGGGNVTGLCFKVGYCRIGRGSTCIRWTYCVISLLFFQPILWHY